MIYRAVIVSLFSLFLFSSASGQQCIDCHKKVNPHIVSDWQLSKHSQAGINCSVCHGTQHIEKEDNILFPMADMSLPEERQKNLSEEFESLERERIGIGKHEEFHRLLHNLKSFYLETPKG